MNTPIRDKNLVQWLIAQGADKQVTYRFVLEKGMGESVQVLIMNEDTVQLTWSPRPNPETAFEQQLMRFAIRQTNEIVVSEAISSPKGYITDGAGTPYGMTTDLNKVKLFTTRKYAQQVVGKLNRFCARHSCMIVSGTPHFEIVPVALTFRSV